MDKKNVALGFDLGVASVGWAIVDADTNEVLHLGSRLFEEPKLAVDRRTFRSKRRLIRRKAYRSRKLESLFFKYKEILNLNISSKEEINNIYFNEQKIHDITLNLKIKAMKEKIDSTSLVWIMHDYLENRGVFYELAEDNEDKKSKEKTTLLADDISPTLLLKEYYDKWGFYKQFETLNNKRFTNKAWMNEITNLLNVQSKYYSEEFKDFMEEYLTIFNYIRSFEHGPGSIHSPSKYGIYDIKNGQIYKKYENVWEKTIGKCSLFINEFRAPKQSTSAEFFDLLNELNNTGYTELKSWKMSKENKIEFLQYTLAKMCKQSRIPKLTHQLLEQYVIDAEPNIDFDVHKFNTINLEEFKTPQSTFILIKILQKYDADLSKLNIEALLNENIESTWIGLFDKIVDILSISKNIDYRVEQLMILKNKFIEYFDLTEANVVECIKEIASNKKINIKNTHSLSYKAIRISLSDLVNIENNYESLKYNEESNLFKLLKSNSIQVNKIKLNTEQNRKYIKTDFLNEAILAPAVKRTMREAVAVFNKIIKKFSNQYTIVKVGIELPRENNDAEQTAAINKIQNKNKKRNKDILDSSRKFLENKNIDWEYLNAKTKEKILLWYQQDGYDVYSMNKLDLYKLITDPSYAEVDHIIPRSILLDNSISNKVVTTMSMNKIKSGKIPYQFIQGKQWDDYVALCRKIFLNKDMNKYYNHANVRIKKYNNLTIQNFDDKTKMEFLNRQLNDTRYSAKLFFNELMNYSMHHNNQFVVHPITGSFTAGMRNYSKMKPKDRKINSHHAFDASIVAITANNLNPFFRADKLNNIILNEKGNVFDSEGEFLCKVDDLNFNGMHIASLIRKNIRDKESEIEEKVRYSWKKVKKFTKPLSHETLYSAKKVLGNGNIMHIETKDIFKISVEYWEKNKEKFLISASDPNLFAILENIFECYKDKCANKNNLPFLLYMNDLLEQESDLFTKEQVQNCLQQEKILLITNKNTLKYIKKLKVYSENKKPVDVLFNTKQNNQSYYNSLKQLAVLVYKNKKNKYGGVAINANILPFDNHSKNLLDETIYKTQFLNIQKDKFNISHESKPLFVLYPGTVFQDKTTKKLYRYVMYNIQNSNLTLSSIRESHIANKVISLVFDSYNIVEQDELGFSTKIELK
ncbi:type II CRISPR RNA-guided endonuclease Cas9 [Mycoplasma phocoenae]|uniref:CRISPR-associated endonuclease Cas9 n=1 Tax=Mycoplasma phocoenae TaxID=754517 RepID=A0A858U335_9MOLU|nr:type II CRISPR RNA-guided endonuclease Cas9 [Mycoplasma phocoenae]QJG66832.1 type II CRISPR RNA-guided endonuclease Cas9 [Mycoplasma phocoenae]